jgi:hypothetical protein
MHGIFLLGMGWSQKSADLGVLIGGALTFHDLPPGGLYWRGGPVPGTPDHWLPINSCIPFRCCAFSPHLSLHLWQAWPACHQLPSSLGMFGNASAFYVFQGMGSG